MRRGCLVASAGAALLLAGAAVYFYFSYQNYQNLSNPSYNGKRADAWAEQAINAPAPAARAEAAEALVVVFRQMKYGRTQLVMRFCYARRGDGTEGHLPQEVLPFLIEALHAPEFAGAPGTYPAIALSQVEWPAAVAPLVEVVLHDDDPHARAGALAALRMMGHGGNAGELLLLRAAREGDEETRRRAEEALKQP